MMNREHQTEKISVVLPNQSIVKIEITSIGREDVSFNTFPFDDISLILEGITTAIKESIEKAKPHKASIKFGLEVGVESGKLAAAIVKGSGKANLEITLEWSDL